MERDFIIENGILKKYSTDNKAVVIPEDVVRIGERAFEESGVTSVTFEGNKLKSIDESAFRECKDLESIVIPDGVIQIGDNAFSGCSKLEYIVIPDTVIVVGENILNNCKKNLLVIGKENTEAANIAENYKLILKQDLSKVIDEINQRNIAKGNVETKTFEILGEKITCSNTIIKYHNNLEYYSERKEVVFEDFCNQLPKTVTENFGDMRGVLTKEEDILIDRLSKQGVYVKIDDLAGYLIIPCNAILEAAKTIRKIYDIILNELNEGINENTQQLISDAESKIRGLSYGVIGDSFDIVAHSLDDYSARKRQRKEAYAQAKKESEEYIKRQSNKSNKLYAEFIAKALPYLKQGIDMFVDALCKAENEQLINAGLIDDSIEGNVDIEKSSQLIESIVDKEGDNSFSLILAIKKYPCNIAALLYARTHGYECEGLINLIKFLGLEKTIDEEIDKIKAKKIKDMNLKLKSVRNANVGVAIIKENLCLLDETDIKLLLTTLTGIIPQRIEKVLSDKGLAEISNVEKYCLDKLDNIISYDTWKYFQKYGVAPIVSSSSIIKTNDYNELIKWLCDKIKELSNDCEKTYCRAKELLSNAKTLSDYQETAEIFKTISLYKDSSTIYEQIEQKLKEEENEKIYCEAKALLKKAKTTSEYKKVNDMFGRINNYKDSARIYSEVEDTISSKNTLKKKIIILAVAILLGLILLAFPFYKAEKEKMHYRELEEAINSGSFSSSWQSNDGDFTIEYSDDRAIQLVADRISTYHKNDDAERALYLITELMELKSNRSYNKIHFSAEFTKWLKNEAIENGKEITNIYKKPEEEKYYKLYDYKFRWDTTESEDTIYIHFKGGDGYVEFGYSDDGILIK